MATNIFKGNVLLQIFDQLSDQTADIDPKQINTAFALLDFVSFALSTFETYLGRHGLSQGRLLILMLLTLQSDQVWSPAKLAKSIGVTRATVTGLLNVLEKDGWVERRPYSKDGRMKEVVLNEAGRKKIDEFIPGHLERVSKGWSNFNDDEIKMLHSLLGKAKISFSSFLDQGIEGNS